MRASHAIEATLVVALDAVLRALPRRTSLRAGAGLGALARTMRLRTGVAAGNLARAFPEKTHAERAAILARHYRELGRIVAEYARLGDLARSPAGHVVAEVRGLEHLERARAAGRGAILLSGHFGNIELLGAWLGRMNPVSFVTRPLSNPLVESWLARRRADAGIEIISTGSSVRRVYQALHANRWVAMLADQDARRHGVFVPFFGVPASTALGPARIAIATGAPIVMGFDHRLEDGRHTLEVEPPLISEEPGAPGAAERLTARHVAALERWVRKHPEMWFWLHRRWKTAPPATVPGREEAHASV